VRTYDASSGFALRVQFELEVVHLSSLPRASKPLSLRWISTQVWVSRYAQDNSSYRQDGGQEQQRTQQSGL
jgi:hypothetical protein